MTQFRLRPVHYTDRDDIIKLAQVSFADEFAAQGLTPDAFTHQLRMMTRGRLIPFSLLARLTHITWEVFVAEVEGKVVGCAMYSGRRHMLLGMLMVDPAYRRQGIGQALLVRRLQRIRERGYPCATVTVLSTNKASRGNLAKQNFEVFDQYSLYEHALPLPPVASPTPGLSLRPVVAADRPHFLRLERETTGPVALQVRDSQADRYVQTISERAYYRLAQLRIWNRAFVLNGEVVGFLAVESSREQRKGMILRPMLGDTHASLLPQMLQQAGAWLARCGHSAAQVVVPDDRPLLFEQLLEAGWIKVLTWLDLVKWFDRERTA